MANNKNRKNNYRRNKSNNTLNPNQQHQRFASTSAIFTGSSSTSSASSVDETRLKSMLRDPAKNSYSVAMLSKSMTQVNGMYKRIINYLSTLLTFDHTIYPVFQNPMVDAGDSATIQESYAQTAIYVDKLNPKYNLPVFTEKIFTSGVTFQYKLEDSKGISYQDMPANLCRVSYLEEGVFRYQMDVTKLSDTTALLYPKEIQTAYNSYKSGNTTNLVEGKYYQVSDKGMAFTIDPDVLVQAGQANPPLGSTLVDVIKVESAKDSMTSTDALDNTKIVHSTVPIDDKGRPTMELNVVQEYHNALKRALPEGAVAITNPFETKSVPLSGTGASEKFGLLDKSIEQLYKSTGVSQQLFAVENNSSNALERSLQVDTQWLYGVLLPLFANYYNYELKKVGKKGNIQWKIKMLPISFFDRDQVIASAKDQLANGGSRLEYLACCGKTPLEIANLFVFEQRVLNIDDLMIVKATAHTTSGTENTGRPESDNPTDDTVRIKDTQPQ